MGVNCIHLVDVEPLHYLRALIGVSLQHICWLDAQGLNYKKLEILNEGVLTEELVSSEGIGVNTFRDVNHHLDTPRISRTWLKPSSNEIRRFWGFSHLAGPDTTTQGALTDPLHRKSF